MFKKRVVRFIVSLAVWAITALGLLAFLPDAPMPPVVIVNHETRQCAIVILGDECVNCKVPEGWVELGRQGAVDCPDGYEEVHLKLECTGIAAFRCCLPGHSGGRGDCTGYTLAGLLILALCCLLPLLVTAVVVWSIRRRKAMQKESAPVPE